MKLQTRIHVDVKTTLEKIPINGEHVHVQVCNFKTLKKLLPRLHYNRDRRKGLLKIMGERVPRSNVEPSPKRQHASTSDDVSIVDVSQEKPKFTNQMTKETQLNNQNTITIINNNISEIVT